MRFCAHASGAPIKTTIANTLMTSQLLFINDLPGLCRGSLPRVLACLSYSAPADSSVRLATAMCPFALPPAPLRLGGALKHISAPHLACSLCRPADRLQLEPITSRIHASTVAGLHFPPNAHRAASRPAPG